MGKSKRRRRAELELAERHDFAGGYLGHDTGSTAYLVNVSEQTALAIDVVYACVRTLADAVASATWAEWRGTERLPDSRLVRRPMARMTRRAWAWRVTATLALYNVCALERVGRDSEGVALSLVPLTPGSLSRIGPGRLLIDGRREVSDDDVRFVRRAHWPTVTAELGSVLKLARDVFAAAWAAEAYTADFWANGGAPQVVLTSDQELSNDDAALIANRWVERRIEAPGKPAVLGKGAEAKALGVDLAGAGIGESGDRLAQSAARYFGVPAWIVNVASAAGSMIYANTESAGLDLVRYTLDGYVGPIADEISDELPADYLVGRRAVLDVSHLTLGTLLERAQAMQIATGGRPWTTPAEARTHFGLPPDRSLDETGRPAPELESIPEGVQ
jgi:phage portal protein BeeE